VSTLTVKFVDGGREAKNPPDPSWPNGMAIDLSKGRKSCMTAVPYPSPRIGYILITCETCGLRTLVTVAGRPDDPHSVTVACKAN
jgi:hypothetical protein